ncbi:MAG: putative zinc-binding metallopeptidase [Thalassobaculum sp.]
MPYGAGTTIRRAELAFDFLSAQDSDEPVMTGHANGVITIDLAEADPVARERMRTDMTERYRTVLGHFRHEIGHYYWNDLVANTAWFEPSRALFGDERADYGDALNRHYETGPPAELDSPLHQLLRDRPSLGGLRRELGALSAHRRHA